MIPYWIQKHDYSAEDLTAPNEAELYKAFINYSWDRELHEFDESDEERNCPPGMGIKHNDQLLHLIPLERSALSVNYHYNEEKKLLGLITTKREQTHHVAKFPKSGVKDLISHFLSGKHSEILAIS